MAQKHTVIIRRLNAMRITEKEVPFSPDTICKAPTVHIHMPVIQLTGAIISQEFPGHFKNLPFTNHH